MKGAVGRGVRVRSSNPFDTSEATRDATSEAVALLAMVVEVDREPDGAPRAGTSAQYDELYRLHYSTVLGMCVRRLHGMADAEDAVQETFVRALAHPEVFSKPAPWLARVAVRVCIDELRRRQRGDLRFAALQASADRDLIVGDMGETLDIAALPDLLTALTAAERRVVTCSPIYLSAGTTRLLWHP